MKVNANTWVLAMSLRGFFASEFLKYHGPTDSQAGITLVNYSRHNGFTQRLKEIPGKTIRDWIVKGDIPQWAVKGMVKYIVEAGFIAENCEQLDSIISYLIIDIDNNQLASFLKAPLFKNYTYNDLISSIDRAI